jgi:hypothetical protein
MEQITVASPPRVAAALIRWHLACGDDRFFESTECFDPLPDTDTDPEDAPPGVILLQCVRALPRAGLTGCSIMVHDLCGRTTVSFAAANNPSWAANDQAVLRDKLVTAFGKSVVPDPEPLPVAALLSQAEALTWSTVDAPLDEPLRLVLGPDAPQPHATVPPAEPETLLEAAPVFTSWETPIEDMFGPTFELARLIADDVRTADDLPDLDSTEPGPITQIEWLSDAELTLIWPKDPELEPSAGR